MKIKLLERYLQTQEAYLGPLLPAKNHRATELRHNPHGQADHVIRVSATTDAQLPDNLWGDFLEQAEIA
jgi:hypothetical protein